MSLLQNPPKTTLPRSPKIDALPGDLKKVALELLEKKFNPKKDIEPAKQPKLSMNKDIKYNFGVDMGMTEPRRYPVRHEVRREQHPAYLGVIEVTETFYNDGTRTEERRVIEDPYVTKRREMEKLREAYRASNFRF